VVALPSLAIEHLKQHKIKQDRGPRTRFRLPSLDWFAGPKYQGCVFHALRHTHATQLLRQGVHPKVVSERLGHATVGITLDVYSHVLPGMQEEAATRTDVALRAALAGS
jgi:integrase